MITATDVTKRFGNILAVDAVTAEIREGSVFGLIGSNGAGKSTFLRMIAGILRPDSGSLMADGMEIYENPQVKGRIFYISDEQYFYSNATPRELRDFYASIYPGFDKGRFQTLMKGFDLQMERKINTFSKGMKKQVSVICGICSGADYLLCDETFDGLDPVARQAVKSLLAGEVAERNMTPVIASHNLRELEDICDHVGIMRHGKMLVEKSLADMQGSTVKLQTVGPAPAGLEILHHSRTGRLNTYIIRGTMARVQGAVERENPAYFDILPLSLEEIFIYELGGAAHETEGLLL